jgi:hypothetical protein
MRICSLSVPRLKHEWNQTVWSVNSLRCGTAAAVEVIPHPEPSDEFIAWHAHTVLVNSLLRASSEPCSSTVPSRATEGLF